MIAGITGGKALPDEVAAQIVDRTDGVPLFSCPFFLACRNSHLPVIRSSASPSIPVSTFRMTDMLGR
jgi:hypothetical protein